MDKRIRNTLDHIEDNLGADLDLGALASVACLSESQFHRLFKKETGSTPFKFTEALRMEKAHQLILKGETLVAEVAESLNYKDYETFSRAYKKHFGLSPDDVKSIASNIRSEIEDEKDPEILIRAIESEDEVDSVFADFEALMNERGIEVSELKNSKVFRFLRKEERPSENATVIKNKFVLDNDQKIWERLVGSLDN